MIRAVTGLQTVGAVVQILAGPTRYYLIEIVETRSGGHYGYYWINTGVLFNVVCTVHHVSMCR